MKLVLKLTNLCNYSCHYCYLKQSQQRDELADSSPFMNNVILEKSLDFVKNNFKNEVVDVSFFGGEPLVALSQITNLFKLIDTKYQNINFRFIITTNGSLISDEFLKTTFEKNIYTTISLDDYTTRDRVLNTIKKFIEEEKKKNKHLLTVRVTVTDPRSDLIALYTKIKNLGVKNIHLVPQTTENYDYDAFIENFTKLYHDIIRNEVFSEHQLRNAQIRFIIETIFKNKVKDVFCSIGEKYLAINTDGVVYPCTGFLDVKGFELGSVILGQDNQILENLSKFRQSVSVELKSTCKSCWAKHICAGQCSHASYLLTGNHSKPYSNECKLMKFFANISLELYKDIINNDETLLNLILYWDQFSELKITIKENVLVSERGFLFKSEGQEHKILELDRVSQEMFKLIQEKPYIQLFQLYNQLIGLDAVNGVKKKDFINSVNQYIDEGFLHAS